MNLRRIVEENNTKAGRIFDLVIQALILVSLISFCIETLPNLSDGTRVILTYLEVITVIIFSIEYVLRISVAQDKLKFIFSFYGIIDLLAVLPFYVASGVDLRAIRILRLFRLFRIFKLFRYSKAIKRFRLAFDLIREELITHVTQ